MRKQWLAWLGWGVLGLIGLAMLVWAVSRVRGPSSVQRAAVSTLSTMPPLAGRNAFQTLWQLPYVIPEQDRAAVFEEDVRRWKALASVPAEGDTPPGLAHDSVAAARYPSSLPEEDKARFCERSRECLASVETDPERYIAVVERHRALLDRIESLNEDAGIRDPFGYPAATPLPDATYSSLPMTRHAVAFVQGRRDEAFDGTCRAIVAWRRLGANSDTLIVRLVGAARARATYAELFLDMLARTPRDQPLPVSCAEAFSPPAPQESSLCLAARGEFAYKRSVVAWMMHRDARGIERVRDSLMFDEEMMLAEMAMPLFALCSPAMERRILRDAPVVRDDTPQTLLRLECASDAGGCILGAISDNDNDYADQIEDTNARLRLVALLLEMRSDASDDRQILERLEERHAAFGAESRMLRLIDDGRALCLDNYRKHPDSCWKIPLPPYFATQTSVATAKTSP